jgi:hypothetical protein
MLVPLQHPVSVASTQGDLAIRSLEISVTDEIVAAIKAYWQRQDHPMQRIFFQVDLCAGLPPGTAERLDIMDLERALSAILALARRGVN